MKRAARSAGFTLIELMVAITIVSMMMVIAWGTTQETLRAKKYYEKVQERYREVRVAMNTMARDINMAYISSNEDMTLVDRRTFFIGETSGDVASLRFSAWAHTKLYADAHEGDQTIIAYYSCPDPEDRTLKDICRRETHRLANLKYDQIPGESDVLFAGVDKLKFEYWDVQQQTWSDTWSTVAADGKPNKIPDKVRITLTFLDERRQPVTFKTETRIQTQEVVQFFTN
jgi:general secretion pathway protein J